MTSVHRLLDHICIQTFSGQLSDKLTKDISKSALRKLERFGSNQAASVAIIKTAALGSINMSVAFLVTDLAQMLAEYLAHYYKQLRLLPHREYPSVDLCQRTGRILLTNSLSYVYFVMGSSVGTFVCPGTGTMIGGLVGDLLHYVI